MTHHSHLGVNGDSDIWSSSRQHVVKITDAYTTTDMIRGVPSAIKSISRASSIPQSWWRHCSPEIRRLKAFVVRLFAYRIATVLNLILVQWHLYCHCTAEKMKVMWKDLWWMYSYISHSGLGWCQAATVPIVIVLYNGMLLEGLFAQ